MSHWDPVTRTSTACKVCQSRYREEIEKKINDRVSNRKISDWVSKQKPAEKISLESIQRHKKNHGFKMRILSTGAQGEKGTVEEIHLKSLNDFLELVIQKVEKGVKEENLKPTVMEGVKAAEIKAKIKEGSKFEKELIKFFLQVSEEHGYSN